MSKPTVKSKTDAERLPIEVLIENLLYIEKRLQDGWPVYPTLFRNLVRDYLDTECTRNAKERWTIEKLRKRHGL